MRPRLTLSIAVHAAGLRKRLEIRSTANAVKALEGELGQGGFELIRQRVGRARSGEAVCLLLRLG